ncbi:MAG: hypothetical protein IPH17_07960 [Bacteroidales bacterium]|nr:hypothetical protein [Bacteroidales bacterium]
MWGEEIIVSNKDLSNNIVKNYKRMQNVVSNFSLAFYMRLLSKSLK